MSDVKPPMAAEGLDVDEVTRLVHEAAESAEGSERSRLARRDAPARTDSVTIAAIMRIIATITRAWAVPAVSVS